MEQLAYGEDEAFALMDDAATVNRIVRMESTAALRERRFEEWRAIDLMAHVTELAEVFAERIRRCLEEDTPTIKAVRDWMPGEAERDALGLAKRMLAAHQRIVAYMKTPGAAERPAVHEEYGRTTAGHMATYHAKHSHEHVVELANAFPPKGP